MPVTTMWSRISRAASRRVRKISADLALHLEPLEAKLAATSQTHDEARHFYVMHDYLKLLDYEPESLPSAAHRILLEILKADSLAKKLPSSGPDRCLPSARMVWILA